MTEAADMTGKPYSVLERIQRSIIDDTAEARETIMNVLRPAECLLLERSQPTRADRKTTRHILKTSEEKLISVDHEPRYSARGS